MADEPDIVVGTGGAEGGKDGSAGYMNASEREEFEEENPDLAAYSSLKFKTPDKPEEPSDEIEAVGALSSTLKDASQEITRLRGQADGRELADGVEQLLDVAEEVADDLDWDEADELRQATQVQALQHAAAIEDEELRQQTFAKLEERVDPDLYESFATEWQQAYADQTEQDIQEGLKRAEAEVAKQLKTFAAVAQLEDDLLNQLSPLEQACATKMLEVARDDIAAMEPADAQEALRAVMEMARDAAGKIEAADTQMRIIHAHGRTKGGVDGRQLKELSIGQLGLLPSLEPTAEEIEAASARAQKGVRIDRQKAKRIHKGTGLTGAEKLAQQTVQVAQALGVPVHDGATGRRIG